LSKLPDLHNYREIRRVREEREQLPDVEGDSDEVYDLGYYEKAKNHRHHRILDCEGSIVVCPKTEHSYLHIIKVPNKSVLKCRGCGTKLIGATGRGWETPSEENVMSEI